MLISLELHSRLSSEEILFKQGQNFRPSPKKVIHYLNLDGAKNIVQLLGWRVAIQSLIRSEFGRGVVISVEPELYQV